jgi:hypothetical protein
MLQLIPLQDTISRHDNLATNIRIGKASKHLHRVGVRVAVGVEVRVGVRVGVEVGIRVWV